MITIDHAEIIQDQNRILKQENDHLKLMIQKLQHQLFGSKFEKVQPPDDDQLIFKEIEAEAKANKATDEELQAQTELTAGYSRNKGRGKKKLFPENLERERVALDLNDDEKICPHDGAQLKEIRFEINKKSKCYPARTVVLIEKKKK